MGPTPPGVVAELAAGLHQLLPGMRRRLEPLPSYEQMLAVDISDESVPLAPGPIRALSTQPFGEMKEWARLPIC